MDKLPPMYKGNPFPGGVIHKNMQDPAQRLNELSSERNILYAQAINVTTQLYILRDGMTDEDAAAKAKDEIDALIAWAPEGKEHGTRS